MSRIDGYRIVILPRTLKHPVCGPWIILTSLWHFHHRFHLVNSGRMSPGELPFKRKQFYAIFAVYAKSTWDTARATMPAIPIELVWVRQVPNAAVRFIPE
jgi:hypothetical protein